MDYGYIFLNPTLHVTKDNKDIKVFVSRRTEPIAVKLLLIDNSWQLYIFSNQASSSYFTITFANVIYTYLTCA